MMKDDELWLKKIKERLDDYSEPLPDTGWERKEKVLPASAPMSVGKKKQIMFRRWAIMEQILLDVTTAGRNSLIRKS